MLVLNVLLGWEQGHSSRLLHLFSIHSIIIRSFVYCICTWHPIDAGRSLIDTRASRFYGAAYSRLVTARAGADPAHLQPTSFSLLTRGGLELFQAPCKGFYPLVDLLFNGPDPVHHSHVISRTTNLCPLCVSRMPDDEKGIEATSLILHPPLPPYLLPQGWLPIYMGKIHCGTFLLGAGGDRVNML